jgi:hypothetical protein
MDIVWRNSIKWEDTLKLEQEDILKDASLHFYQYVPQKCFTPLIPYLVTGAIGTLSFQIFHIEALRYRSGNG